MAKKTDTTGMNIYQKLAVVRKRVEVMKKTKRGANGNYVPLEDILASIQDELTGLHLSLYPQICGGTTVVTPNAAEKRSIQKVGDEQKEVTTFTNTVIVQAEMNWLWVNDDDPTEAVMVPWILVGQNAGASQAFGSGLTYSTRYFLTTFFGIARTDDPDSFEAVKKEAEARADAEISSAVIAQADTYIRTYLAVNPDDKDAVLELAKTFVKNGDYRKITKSDTATAFLATVQEKFKLN